MIFLAVTVIISKVNGDGYQVFGYQIKSVLSGSMEPTFMTGSVIALEPGGDMTRFQPGDIITFKVKENMLITHRVVEVVQNEEKIMYRTKGDHNNGPDRELVSPENVVGKYTGFTIPYAGYVLSYASTNWGNALLLIIPGLFLILNSVFSVLKGITEIEKQNKKSMSRKEISN